MYQKSWYIKKTPNEFTWYKFFNIYVRLDMMANCSTRMG